jgi:hypothetical protein
MPRCSTGGSNGVGWEVWQFAGLTGVVSCAASGAMAAWRMPPHETKSIAAMRCETSS